MIDFPWPNSFSLDNLANLYDDQAHKKNLTETMLW